jgi:CubicO group peptidase (beta-lactamase class C family)
LLSARRFLTALLLAVATASAGAAPRCGLPETIADGTAVATRESSTLAVDALCERLAQVLTPEMNVHGVLFERGGTLQFEAYLDGNDRPNGAVLPRPASFGPGDLHDLRSITKSVTSLLYGIALERKLVPSVDTPLFAAFPDHADLRTPERDRITLAHLLTMSHGWEWDESGNPMRWGNNETRMRNSRDPVRYVLERPIALAPGEKFVYSGGAPMLLGELIARGAGMPLEKFAEQALFEPLGIRRYEWRREQREHVTAWGGLRLRPRDVLRIGRMALDKGRWQGQQIVPAAWIEESTRGHLSTGAGSTRYGYQWWVNGIDSHGRRYDFFAGLGNGGQRLIVVPELDLVIAITAGQYNLPDEGRGPWLAFRAVMEALTR